MDRLLRISERTNIVIHALAYIAAQKGEDHVAVKKMAEDLKVSVTYLAKVLQPLVKEGLLESTRGAKGGFLLKKDPKEISMAYLVELVEGPLPAHNCLFGKPICKKQSCAFSELNRKVKDIVVESLKNTTLYDVRDSFY